ncbi:hypothetical protein GCM10022255_114460 [Dactylosporangium darangshiense]|uniref:Uncharacterized protein n=1 Tax=Dactylosporangium darangshiense TaxID=579108 RepID=A0ABP8DVM8_9ACTN
MLRTMDRLDDHHWCSRGDQRPGIQQAVESAAGNFRKVAHVVHGNPDLEITRANAPGLYHHVVTAQPRVNGFVAHDTGRHPHQPTIAGHHPFGQRRLLEHLAHYPGQPLRHFLLRA